MLKRPAYHYDSRKILPGDTFLCLPKGNAYIQDAKDKGAQTIQQVSRREFATLSSEIFNHPSRSLKVMGITGTNGKTTVSYLVHQALTSCGFNSAYLGTLNSELTTPESFDIQRMMSEHLAAGGTHFVMEVSSHGIDQDRVYGIDFDVTCLTNISRDHLDYHPTFEDYKSTKLRFLSDYPGSSIYPKDFESLTLPFETPLPGRFNHLNFQASYSILKALKLSDDLIVPNLIQSKAPPGRFEFIDKGQPFSVVVDFAHTPDSLQTVLNELRLLSREKGSRLLTLFGCGGDRDRGKRPEMGKIAEQLSDFCVVTSDNPRSEDQVLIAQDILAGLSSPDENVLVQHDRKLAIHAILELAKPGDFILIAGKGHETYQILPSGKIDFDDRQHVITHLKHLGYPK